MTSKAPSSGSGPKLSIVVVAYEMARELPRTLLGRLGNFLNLTR